MNDFGVEEEDMEKFEEDPIKYWDDNDQTFKFALFKEGSWVNI